LIIKGAICFYLVVFMIGEITASTSAYFTTTSNVRHNVSSGTWKVEPDLSDLVFIPTGEQNIKKCPANVTVTLKNKGKEDIKVTSKYEVYASGGTVVGSGTVPALAAGEKVELQFTTSDSGSYYFTAGNNESGIVTSKPIKVDCGSGGKNDSPEEPQKDEAANEGENPNQSDTDKTNGDKQDESQEPNETDDSQGNSDKQGEEDIKNDGEKSPESEVKSVTGQEKENVQDGGESE
jgi:YqxM protein